MEKVKGTSRNEVFKFAPGGKMLIPVDCDKPYVYPKMPRATMTKTVQRDTMRNAITKDEFHKNV